MILNKLLRSNGEAYLCHFLDFFLNVVEVTITATQPNLTLPAQ